MVKFSFLGIVKNEFCSTTHRGSEEHHPAFLFIGAVATSCQSDTVGGRNPAPVDMVRIEYPLFTRFYTSQVSSSITASLLSVFCFHDQTLKDLKSWLVVEPPI